MKSVLRGGEITADILLDSVEVNDIPAPPGCASPRAGTSPQPRRSDGLRPYQARHADPRFLRPDRNRYFARLDVDSLDMALLDPILAGVVSSTEGMASAGLTLQARAARPISKAKSGSRG